MLLQALCILVFIFSCEGKPKGNKPECTLDMKTGCPKIYMPVCGSNDITYANNCELCARSYSLTDKGQQGLSIKYPGECNDGELPQEEESAKKTFPLPVDCAVVKPGKGCPRHLQQVCGTDGQTHSNPCMMCQAMEDTGKNIQITKFGRC